MGIKLPWTRLRLRKIQPNGNIPSDAYAGLITGFHVFLLASAQQRC
jgi:hypothetical protein